MIKAISLWQPWASLIAVGAKKIETRGWKTDYRGLLAIHAAQKLVPISPGCVPEFIAQAMLRAIDTNARPMRPQDFFYGLPRGVIVAVAEIYACFPTEQILAEHPDWSAAEKHFGDFSPGRFGWFLKNNIALKTPVKCKGRQGFFFLPAEVERQVKSQL